jgi:hypothetical protein
MKRYQDSEIPNIGCLLTVIGTIAATIFWIIVTVMDKDSSHLVTCTVIGPMDGMLITGLCETPYPDWGGLLSLVIIATISGYTAGAVIEILVTLIRDKGWKACLVILSAFFVMMVIGITLTILPTLLQLIGGLLH